MDYVTRIEQQLQALKGLIMTFGAADFANSYAAVCTKDPQLGLTRSTGMNLAYQRILQATTWINNFSTCLSSSVLAHCISAAFSLIPGSSENAQLQETLDPLRTIVERKVWAPEERKVLFDLCLNMLCAFWSKDDKDEKRKKFMYQNLIDEIRTHFPEETAEYVINYKID